jgi:hypothetical protein
MDASNINSIPFIYLVTSPTMGANGTSQVTLLMQADSRFELHGIFGTSSTDANSDFSSNNFSLLITDQTTGRQLMSNRVPQRILCGNAFNGYLQRRPIVFEPQSNILFDFLNLTAGASFTVNIALAGYKFLL